MTKTIKVSPLKKVILVAISDSCPYTQSQQTSDIEFSILNRVDEDSFRELHYQVRCREYLGDTNVAAHLNKDTPTIYGFKLTGERMPLNESLFSLSVKENSYNNLINNMHIINNLEKEMKIPKKSQSKLFDTGIYDSSSDRRKLVLVGPSDWMKSPLLVSLYTFMIRILTYKQGYDTIEEYLDKLNINGSDSSYCISLNKLNIRFLLKNIDKVLGENPVTGLDDHSLHSSEDIFSDSSEKPLKFSFENKEHQINYGIWRNHGEHGFVSFKSRVDHIDDFFIKKYQFNCAPIGFKWAINYTALLKRKKITDVAKVKKKAKLQTQSPNILEGLGVAVV